MWYVLLGGGVHSSIVPLCTCNQLNSHRTSANTSAQAQVDQTKLQLSLEQAQQDVVYMGGGAFKYCVTK